MSKEIYSSTAPGVFLCILGDFSSGGYFPLQTLQVFEVVLAFLHPGDGKENTEFQNSIQFAWQNNNNLENLKTGGFHINIYKS